MAWKRFGIHLCSRRRCLGDGPLPLAPMLWCMRAVTHDGELHLFPILGLPPVYKDGAWLQVAGEGRALGFVVRLVAPGIGA